MLLLLVNLYEFGQFLRIVLWISLPMVIVAMLVTTWLHYRRKRMVREELVLSMEGLDPSMDPQVLIAAMKQPTTNATTEQTGEEDSDPAIEGEPWPTVGVNPADTENMYRGILWMKEKYEQYRDLSDQKIFQLKEELNRVEQKYQDLLATRSPAQQERTQLHKEEPQQESAPPQEHYSAAQQQLLEQKDRQIEELQAQLQVQWQKTEELVVKLQNSSHLLLSISREMDKTLDPAPPQANSPIP